MSPQISRQTASDASLDEDKTLRTCVAGIGDGDQHALGRFYDATNARVYSLALRIVRLPESAEEVVSDVYLQVWREAARYDPTRGRVMGWLLIIARSRALDHHRRKDEAFSHPDPHELAASLDSTEDGPQDLLMATQSGHAVHAALKALTPIQRQLLSLAFFRGLSHAEIVAHSGLPLGTVKTHIRRALAAMREALAPTEQH